MSHIHEAARWAYSTLRHRMRIPGVTRLGRRTARLLARLGPVQSRCMDLEFVLDLHDHVDQLIFWQDYDRSILREWSRLLAPGHIVFDVGANVGLYSLVAARAGARVYAFEPSPDTRERLRANLALNAVGEHVVIRSEALSENEGQATLFADVRMGSTAFNSGVASLSSVNAGGSGVSVTLSTIDSIVSELGIDRLDWIKMDIQGAELAALKGGRNALKALRPRIMLEFDPASAAGFGWTRADLEALLQAERYSLRKLEGINWIADPR